jgi:hypothetical protein
VHVQMGDGDGRMEGGKRDSGTGFDQVGISACAHGIVIPDRRRDSGVVQSSLGLGVGAPGSVSSCIVWGCAW